MHKCILLVLMATIVVSANAKVFHTSNYGCVTDGRDNAPLFKKIAEDINNAKGGTLVFDKGGQYYVEIKPDYSSGHTAEPSEEATVFLFKNCRNLRIDLNGSSIIVKSNNSTKYAVFRFLGCTSFDLSNGMIVGDADSHDYSYVVYGGKKENSTHEWGHGIIVNGSTGIIERLSVSNMTGDGIKTGSFRSKAGTFHAKVTIQGVEVFNCRRNGIACLSSYGTKILDSEIHDIGSFENVKGTSPEAGIDLEYEDGVGDNGPVSIVGCHIYNCSQKVISASNTTPPTPKTLTIKNCDLEGSTFQISNAKVSGKITVVNTRVNGCSLNLGSSVVSGCIFNLPKGISYVNGTFYKKCSFYGALEGFNSPYGCSLAGYDERKAVFEKCKFKDIRGVNTRSQAYQGFSGFNFPLQATFSECTFDNCSFVRGNPKYKSNFTFYKSHFKNKCLFFNESSDEPIVFDRCELENVESYLTQIGRFIIKYSHLVQNDKSLDTPLLQFGDNTFEKSTIEDKADYSVQLKKHNVRSLKVNAKNSVIHIEENAITTGMSLFSCTITGVSKDVFAGESTKTKYKERQL